MSTALIKYGDHSVQLETPELLRDEALEAAALLGPAMTAEQNDVNYAALDLIERCIKTVEEDRVRVGWPYLEMKRRIDKHAKDWCVTLKAERARLLQYASDFAALDKAKLKAAEATRIVELSDIDRRRQAEIATANNLDEIDEIQARYNEEAKSLPPLPEPARAEGQRVTDEWEIIVVDIHLLARCHPNCVTTEPRLSEIKFLLNRDVKVAGVIAKRITKAGVRVKAEPVLTI